jgi:Peroxiredoxin
MKLLKLALFVGVLIIVSCNNKSGEKFEINGTWDNGEGKTVYIRIKDSITGSLVNLDSTIVGKNNKFCLKGYVDGMTPATLGVGEQSLSIILYKSAKPIQAEITSIRKMVLKKGDTDSTETVVNKIQLIEPERDITIYQNGEDLILGNSLIMLSGMLMMKKAVENGQDLDSVYMVREQMKSLFDDSVKKFLDSVSNSQAVTFVLKDFILTQYPIDFTKEYWEKLSPEVKESVPGRKLYQAIRKHEQVCIGGVPDDFSLPTPNGEEISLYSLRGNIVLLDFWASWCRPCLAEVPNIKKIYEKHHDKGFEILGVSLDEEKDREKWLGAIEKNEMGWKHVSSLKGWECPIAKRFNVTGIPCMYILDKNGKIIAQNLRGEELANKIDELFSTVK